jgi:hypothetical protein
MIAVEGDTLVYVAVASLGLGILLAVFDNWFWNRQRRRRRERRDT